MQWRNDTTLSLTGPSARREVIWHLYKMLCRKPRRLHLNLCAEVNCLSAMSPPHSSAWRGLSPLPPPTNVPAFVEQSSTPAAVQPRPPLSCPASRGSRPADDAVQLQKAFRLLLP